MITELRVDRIAGGGEGVGREASGRVVFVPRTAPGDVVRVDIVEEKKRWARGRARELLREGEGRRPAPCPVYRQCGGCRLQHLTPAVQRRVKRELVREALSRIGGLDVAVPPLVSGGGEFGYRNRMTFTSRDTDGRHTAGFKSLDDPALITDVSRCLLAEEPIQKAWRALRQAWSEGVCTPPRHADARITVRAAQEGTVDVLIHGGRPTDPSATSLLLDRIPGLAGWHHAGPGRDPVCLAGDGALADRWQGIRFDLPPDVFLQVNRLVSAEMDCWLDQEVGDVAGQRVLDLYAGVGARAIRWSRAGADVTACELSERAAATCRAAAGETRGGPVVLAGRVEDHIVDLLPADLVVVNPPRAGLSRRVSEALVAGVARNLAYVSCDPATLARDLVRLAPAWKLRKVQPFDAFPQTAHVETIVWLHRC